MARGRPPAGGPAGGALERPLQLSKGGCGVRDLSSIEPHHREVLDAFERNQVDYVLVGGVGLQTYGVSQATDDVDVIVAKGERNAERVALTLQAIGAGQLMPGELGSTYGTPLGRVEVLNDSSGVGDYEEWIRRAEGRDLGGGLTVQVGAADDLVLSKEAAGRPKDRDVLPRIRGELLRAGELTPEQLRGPVLEPVERREDPRVSELLGPRPKTRPHAALWDRSEAQINDFHRRWSIPDSELALGDPEKAGTDQQNDRATLERALKRTRRLLGQERGLEPEL